MSALVGPPRRLFSGEETERMLETGILSPDERLELIEGELVVVSPQGTVHASLVVRIRRLLERIYTEAGHKVHVRDRSPFDAELYSRPEPDIAVTRGEPEDYLDHHPRADAVFLIVEISHSTRAIDRRKSAIYARAGVPAYWIVDVDADRLEIRESA